MLAHERAHLTWRHHRLLAMAAAATDAVQRIRRLLHPAEPLGTLRRHLLRTLAAGLALLPVALAPPRWRSRWDVFPALRARDSGWPSTRRPPV